DPRPGPREPGRASGARPRRRGPGQGAAALRRPRRAGSLLRRPARLRRGARPRRGRLPQPARRAARRRVTRRRIAGGDINQAYEVELEDGTRAFLKTREGAPADEYATEAAGLRWLAEPGALRVPRVLAAAEDALTLEWIEGG